MSKDLIGAKLSSSPSAILTKKGSLNTISFYLVRRGKRKGVAGSHKPRTQTKLQYRLAKNYVFSLQPALACELVSEYIFQAIIAATA